MDYTQVQAFFAVLLAIAGGITVIGGVVSLMTRFWKWAHRDSEKNAEDIGEVHDWLASDKRRIENLERRQEETEKMNKLQLKALFTLLGHEIDGNHTSQLADVRDEINRYLIEK